MIFIPVALAEKTAAIESNDSNESNYGIGDIVHSHDLTIVVLGWNFVEPEQILSTQANKIVAVDIIMIDDGPDVSYPIYQLDLIDDGGENYEVDVGTTYKQNKNNHFDGGVFPGETVRGTLIFQVPEQSKGYALALRESPQSSNADVFISLGQESVALNPPAEMIRMQGKYGMGEIIELKDQSLAVLGWRISPGSEGSKPHQGMKLLVIDILHINSGNTTLEFSPVEQFHLQDESLHQYESDPRFAITPESPTTLIETSPGEEARVSLVYDVPEESKDFLLNYIPDNSGTEKVFIDLGSNQTAFEVPDLSRFNQTNHRLGEVINSGDLILSVLGWKYASQMEILPCKECKDNRFINYPEKGTKFVIVDLLLQNLKNASRYSGTITLKDSLFHTYQQDWQNTPHKTFSRLRPLEVELYPYMIAHGAVIFQVPENSSGYSLVLDTGVSEKGRTIVDLGPVPVNQGLPANFQVQYPKTHEVGEIITQGDLMFSVLGWGIPIGGEPNNRIKYVYVDILVTNSGSKRESKYSSAEPKLQDNRGFIYENVEGFQYYVGDLIEWGTGLDSGESKRDQILFEVPDNLSDYYFIFDPAWLFVDGNGGDPIVVNLGSEPVSLNPMDLELKVGGGL
jgi:hypothetical protein